LQATLRASPEAIKMAEDSSFARGQSVGLLGFRLTLGHFGNDHFPAIG